MKTNLPNGWALTTLKEVCQKVESISPDKDSQSTFKYIDIASIDNSIYRVVGVKEYTGKDAPSRARQLVHTADTLISTVRPYLRKIAFVSEDLDGQIASTGFTVVRAKEGIDPKYVFYNAISDDFINSLSEKQRGASYPAVRDSDVFEQQIPVPPLAEQHRIVAKLDEAMQRVEASQKRLEKLPGLLKQFRQAVLEAAVSGRLTETWRMEYPQSEAADVLITRLLEARREKYEAALVEAQYKKTPKQKKPELVNTSDTSNAELPELPDSWLWVDFATACEKIFDGTHFSPKNYAKGDYKYITAKNIKVKTSHYTL